jgi:hypothetical protein
MPRGDGTGPRGMGPMTGRAAGYCAGYEMPGYMNPIAASPMGMGFGRGRRFAGRGFWSGGRGRRNMFYATGLPGWMRFGPYSAPNQKPGPEMEKEALKNQAEALQTELDLIKRRLAEIENEATAA